MTSKCWHRIHLTLGFLGLFVGLSGFLVFVVTYKNYQAGLWALISAVFATLCLHMHLMARYERLQRQCSIGVMRAAVLSSGLFCCVAAAALIYYIYRLAQHNYDFYPISSSAGVQAVMCFLAFKWSLTLCVTAAVLRRRVINEPLSYRPISEQHSAPDSDLVVDISA